MSTLNRDRLTLYRNKILKMLIVHVPTNLIQIKPNWNNIAYKYSMFCKKVHTALFEIHVVHTQKSAHNL